MKKLITFICAAAISGSVAFAQAPSHPSDVLKDPSNFEKSELFNNEAVFMNPQLNLEVVNKYEANPKAFSDKALLPIAICYLTRREPEKTKSLLEKFIKSEPNNAIALRTYATIQLLTGDAKSALENYEKAYSLGDKESAKLIVRTHLASNNHDAVSKYVPDLKEFAKTDLFSANMLLIYAYRKPDVLDTAFAKAVITAIDPAAALSTANPESFANALNLYLANKGAWTAEALVIPARGAALGGHWGIARDIYEQVLEANPKNTTALRGKAVVEYSLGGIMESADLIKKAIAYGDKAGANDAMELVILTKDKDPKLAAMFAESFKGFDFTPQVRLSMLGFGMNNDDKADIFFAALTGKNGELLLAEPGLANAIETGLKKYSLDPRAAELQKKLSSKK